MIIYWYNMVYLGIGRHFDLRKWRFFYYLANKLLRQYYIIFDIIRYKILYRINYYGIIK